MEFDAIAALVVLAILVTIVVGVVWWARSAPPYDDGLGGSYVTYLPEPEDARRLPGAPDTRDTPRAATDEDRTEGEPPPA